MAAAGKYPLYCAVLFLFYSISYGALLLFPGFFWDDYSLFGIPRSVVEGSFLEAGRPLFAVTHGFLTSLPGSVYIYKILIFVLYFANGLLARACMMRFAGISAEKAWVIAYLVVLLPYAHSRYGLVMVQYPICTFLFLSGLYVYLRFIKLPARVVCAVLFFLSFSIEAHLVLYYAVFFLMYLLLDNKTPVKGLRSTGPVLYGFVLKYRAMLLLPVVYWIVRGSLFAPKGVLSGLNAFGKKKLLLSPLRLLESLYHSFIKMFYVVIEASVKNISIFHVVIMVAVAGILFLLWKPAGKTGVDRKNIHKGFMAGLFLYFAAAFPFVLVGNMPEYLGWAMRFQFLLPYGAALMIWFISSYAGWKWQRRILIGIVALSVNYNLIVSLVYARDWMKQQALVSSFRNNEEIRKGTSFFLRDHTSSLNAYEREMMFYEFSGMMKQAFGDQKRLAILEFHWLFDRKKIPSYLEKVEYRQMFNLAEYVMAPMRKVIFVEHGAVRLEKTGDTLEMIYLSFADPPEYSRRVSGMIRTRVSGKLAYYFDNHKEWLEWGGSRPGIRD